MIHRRALTIAAAAGLTASGSRAAEPFPNRPIRVLVGFAAGGAVDIALRTVSPLLSEALGQSIIVDNRGGAGGNIAAEIVVRAPPDGYTLMISSPGVLIVNPVIYQNLPFDPVNDLVPIATLVDVSSALVVPADKPWRSVADLVEAARRQPGRLNWAYSGVGSTNHIAGGMLANLSRIETVAVPYRGGGPLMTDLVAGRLDFAFSTLPPALPHLEAGRLRAIAVPMAQRARLLPDVPTVAEAGIPGFEVSNTSGFLAPRGTPQAVIARLNAAVNSALASAALAAQLARQGLEGRPGTTADYAAFLAAERQRWLPIIAASNIQPE